MPTAKPVLYNDMRTLLDKLAARQAQLEDAIANLGHVHDANDALIDRIASILDELEDRPDPS